MEISKTFSPPEQYTREQVTQTVPSLMQQASKVVTKNVESEALFASLPIGSLQVTETPQQDKSTAADNI